MPRVWGLGSSKLFNSAQGNMAQVEGSLRHCFLSGFYKMTGATGPAGGKDYGS